MYTRNQRLIIGGLILLLIILGSVGLYMYVYKNKQQYTLPEAPKSAPKQIELVFFHLNGCGPCGQFKPVWEDLREKYQMV